MEFKPLFKQTLISDTNTNRQPCPTTEPPDDAQTLTTVQETANAQQVDHLRGETVQVASVPTLAIPTESPPPATPTTVQNAGAGEEVGRELAVVGEKDVEEEEVATAAPITQKRKRTTPRTSPDPLPPKKRQPLSIEVSDSND